MRTATPLPVLKRRARLLARREAIPLHAALDRIAHGEGFSRWSLLAAESALTMRGADVPAKISSSTLLPKLVEGDLLLLGARPGNGKTLMGLRLLLEAAESGRRAVFFTLEYTVGETEERLAQLKDRTREHGVEIVASDDICAHMIAIHLRGSPRGTVAVIDYLQILDQDRAKPPLKDQVEMLGALARKQGFVLGLLSQIDRGFDPARSKLPGMGDVRLPNPVALSTFTKTCFIHAGHASFEGIA